MHIRETVELGALVAAHGGTLIACREGISQNCLEQYWCASRCRFDRWAQSLKSYDERLRAAEAPERAALWRSIRPTLEEILTGELLTRAWTAVAVAHDRAYGRAVAGPVARSVFVSHLEARNRALNVMVYGQGFSVDEAVALNRIRRRTERWTDMLLGYLIQYYDVRAVAFDAGRVLDFADSLQRETSKSSGRPAWQLIVSSLRSAYQSDLSPTSPSGPWNERIVDGILSCFDAVLFDSTGLLQSLWMLRATCATDETLALIDDMLTVQSAAEARR